MFPKLTKWCGQWRRRRTQCGNKFRPSHLFVISITLIVVSLTSAQRHGRGDKTEKRKYRYDYDDNLASDKLHYYVDEVIIQSHDVDDKFVGLNVLLRNLTQGDTQQKVENILSKPGSSHLSGNQNFFDASGAHDSSTVQPIKNVEWKHENKIPVSNVGIDNVVTQIATPVPVLPVIENGFEYHFAQEQMGDKKLLNPHPPSITASFNHPNPEFEVVKRKKHRGHYISIISIIGIYLFLSVLAYGALILSESQCATSSMDVPLNWKFHASRRFLPAQSIDPHLQQRFLKLFRGNNEHDDADSDELFSSNEKYLDDELEHINTLCPRNAFFFSLSPRHVEAYSALKLLFLQQDSPEAVISLAKYLLVNEKVHPKVFYIALVGAKLDRQDMAGFSVAHPLDAIPDWYIPADLIVGRRGKYWRGGNGSQNTTFIPATKSKRKGDGDDGHLSSYVIQKKDKWKKTHRPHRYLERDNTHRRNGKYKKKGKKGKQKKKDCITVDWRVGVDNGIENELWYWREDLQLNQHHWYWHQTHPPNSTQHGDRRAELFFYMHRAFIARYNAERLSVGMARVAPLQMRRGGIIPDGYNSHLADLNSGLYWAPRGPQTPLQDVYHEDDPDLGRNITFIDYSRNYRRLIKATKSGKLMSEMGHPISINHPKGIEPLVNTVDASDLSVNPRFYDPAGIHTLGHILVGMAADPHFQFRGVPGIMSDGALSMRDPSFYNYHLFLDNLFELHKKQLPPYRTIGGEFPLLWNGVEVVNIQLHSQGGGPPNELRTFWTHRKFDLSPGVDGSIDTDEHSKVCAQHLDHEPFSFQIFIDRKPCVNSMSGKANVRIFMAPRYDEKGRRIPIKVQRRLMFPLDSFPVKLKVGRNIITRNAEDSSLTQPWTKSLRDLESPSISAEYCGCGWPQHLYIPKGNPGGMAFDLFAMVTNYDDDYVRNDPQQLKIPETCNSPHIFCGLPRRRYPDKKPMGYPFDRPLFKSLNCPPGGTFFSVFCKTISATLFKPINTLEQYVSRVPNMAMLKFHIKHLDVFRAEPVGHY